MVRGLEKWDGKDSRTNQVRNYCRTHMEPEAFIQAVETRSAETCANIAITMLHQFDVMICHLIETQKQRFLQEGGIKEQMYRARVQQRGERSARSSRSTQGAQSDQSSQSSQSSRSSQSTQNKE